MSGHKSIFYYQFGNVQIPLSLIHTVPSMVSMNPEGHRPTFKNAQIQSILWLSLHCGQHIHHITCELLKIYSPFTILAFEIKCDLG